MPIRMTKEDLKWQAKSDVDALRRADEIRMDKARFARAQKEAQAQVRAISSIAGTSKTRKK